MAEEVATSAKNMNDFEKRPYQEAIIDICVKRNSIVYLPTGAGKTYIAIQVIKHFSKGLERKYSEGGFRSVFLVNTVSLAKQQTESIRQMLPYKVQVLVGELNVDYWKLPDWEKVLEDFEILVATAQVVLDAIRHSYINVNQINVIVFDECHHGRKDHAFHEIMKLIPMDNSTRVIGLSGMLIGNDSKIKPATVADELRCLEGTFNSTIITVNSLDDYKNVLICSTNACEGYLSFAKSPTPSVAETVSGILLQMQQKLLQIKLSNYQTINPKTLRPTTPRKVKDLILIFKDFDYQAGEMGAYGGYLSLLSMLIQFELTKRFSDTVTFRDIVKACITTTERCINRMEQELGLSRQNSAAILKNSSHKIQRLFKLLLMKFNDPDREKDMQCLIFVERRSTAKVLYHTLKAFGMNNPDFPIIPDFVVGVNNELPESIEVVVNGNYNSLALERFKNKETNCIVSSSVLEEGIDLTMCNLVVMYDSPKTYRSYVQARGRARVDKSSYVVMIENGKNEKFQKNVVTWRTVDIELKKNLVCKTIDREAPSLEEIERERENAWEPFVTPISRSVLNNCNAVSLINHYSMQMPTDCFTNVNVMWRRIDNEDGTVSAAIQLPSQSVLKDEIISDPQPNVKLAKQHAAWLAGVKLYECGELNDNLVPVGNTQKVEQFNEQYFSHWDDYAGDSKQAGTRNHRRYHKVKTPDVLKNSAPKVGAVSFLYRIKVLPKFNSTNFGTSVVHELLANGNEYGILTSNRLPRMCKMPLFMSQGEVEVEISSIPAPLTLKDSSQLHLLQNFHVVIFHDIVKTWEKFLVLDKMSLLIVPLKEDSDIDWNLVKRFQSVEQPRRLSYSEICATDFNRENYIRRVINPVYRYDDKNYIVIDVKQEMTPLSPFPNDDYESYRDYFESKFDLSIVKTSQPMIEVKGISANPNLFFPGQGASGKMRKHEKEQLTEHYVPELCHNYEFPGDFWLKATLLPSVLHRMNFLLLAEELRMWLIDENIDAGRGNQVYHLDVDYGSYDEREKELLDIEREESTNGKFLKVEEIFKNFERQKTKAPTDEVRHTSPLLLWEKSELPIDLDRNWLTVSEVDIDYYCKFIDLNKDKLSPATITRLSQQLTIGSPSRNNKFLEDKDRKLIRILKLNGRTESVQQKDLIKVLTTSNAGDVFDMERFEVLGDGFLKFIVSLYLFKKHEDWHEGYLTSLKGRLVSNRNLFYVGNNFGLPEMIKSIKFSACESLPTSSCLPPNAQKFLEENKTSLINLLNITPLSKEEIVDGYNLLLPLEGDRDPNEFEHGDDGVEKSMLTYIKQHHVGDKIIADAVEAFLGVVVQSLGVSAGLKMCQKLKILPSDENLDSLLSERIPPRLGVKNASLREARIQNRAELEEILGYKFVNPFYLVQALTHSSYPVKSFGTYQNLEFLGDAVLDFLVTSYIIENCPKMDPGKLTDLRSALVNNVTLACVVVRNGINKFLLYENLLLSEAIKKFVFYQKSQNHDVVLDQIILLETEEDTNSAESVDVPKVIGDVFESLIGAIFLDSGLSLKKTWDVIYNLLSAELHKFMVNVPMQIVRQLFEFEKGKAEPKFYEAEKMGEDVGVPLKINCRGEEKIFLGVGKNKSLAKKCAAKLALKALKQR